MRSRSIFENRVFRPDELAVFSGGRERLGKMDASHWLISKPGGMHDLSMDGEE
jgi:hypothetical protein